MYNPRNNNPYGGDPYGNPYGGGNRRRSRFDSPYRYQTLPYGYSNTAAQSSSLMAKVLNMLGLSFLVASIGAFFGISIGLSSGASILFALLGLVVLIALQFLIQRPGINLFLLYSFTFLEGLSLAPLLGYYLYHASGILFEAFAITAVASLGLGIYAWTTKRDFSRLGDYLFWGLILLIVASLIGFFFHSPLFYTVIAFVGVAIFSGFVLFYIQRAKYMADTTPNAIGLTISIFLTVLNLFLYILEILSIFQRGNNR
ncbi:hypothetical protein KSC_060540 [Ktedonobacter sp. SOSP1-52]|uniref:Bax inhibitor-1/YccA family protein n=1 Tax=Ktedonobacter sp. SOSP1-52 TaxID=2778366 RepID=UPI0019160AF5|nr:Bax inhibitor-1/YccA family protein [Ktedonobacter sp. SOSP1-52]GHO67162.1 hypothetical protein KSC_060540 [Ktedonobacter sp. SOSP1-52]